MTEPILVHVLEEISQDGHCESIDLVQSHQAIVLRRSDEVPVFEVYSDTADETSLQADLVGLQTRGKIEIITDEDYIRRFSDQPTQPTSRPPTRYDHGGPYDL